LGTLVLNRVWLYRNKANEGGGLFSDGSATLNEVNVQANEAQGEFGGIKVDAGSLDVSNSAITNNAGGGVAMNGKMTLLNVTISGNIDPGHGGSGVAILGGGATLQYVTITANGPSDKSGQAIFKTAASAVTFQNSIVWENGKNPQCGVASEGDVITPFSDGGFNIFGDESCLGSPLDLGTTSIIADPKLDALSYNGGFFGLTHALKSGSLAIDLVPQDKCTSRDQRGVTRPIDGDGDGKLECDAGAFEFKP
jgi:hypothetical protein